MTRPTRSVAGTSRCTRTHTLFPRPAARGRTPCGCSGSRQDRIDKAHASPASRPPNGRNLPAPGSVSPTAKRKLFPCRGRFGPARRVRQSPKEPRATDEPDAHQDKDKMEQSVTEGGSQSRSHARARSRQAGSLPSRLRPVATPPVPTADPRQSGTPTAGSWNSNYPGCSARCSLREQVRLVRAYAKQSATYVDVHMDDGVS